MRPGITRICRGASATVHADRDAERRVRRGAGADLEHRLRLERQPPRIGVALASRDADELIRVRSRSLRMPDDYLEIVRELTDAGRKQEAIEWAQRGLTAMAERVISDIVNSVEVPL